MCMCDEHVMLADAFNLDWNMTALTETENDKQQKVGKHIKFVYSESGEMLGSVQVENKHPLQITAEADLVDGGAEPTEVNTETEATAADADVAVTTAGAEPEECEELNASVERMALPDGQSTVQEALDAATSAARARKDGFLPKGTLDGDASAKTATHIKFT